MGWQRAVNSAIMVRTNMGWRRGSHRGGVPETWIALRRARGVWLKMIADVSPYPTPLLAHIDGLLGAPAESLQLDSASHDGHIA